MGCGGRSIPWSQDRFLKQHCFGKKGVCGPLAAKWIKDSKHRLNFGPNTETKDGREEVMQLALNQLNKHRNFVAEYLKLFGICLRYSYVFHGEVSLSQLMTIVMATPGYYFIGFTDPESGHAFAIDMVHCKFFDPNFGQATFTKKDDLKQCFTQWYRLLYMNLHGSAYVERYL